MSDVTRAGDFWDAEVADPIHTSWMEDLRVRIRINTMIGEDGKPIVATTEAA